MRQKKWTERIGGNPGLIIIGAFIVLSIILATDHLFNLPQLFFGAPPEQFEWGEVVFDLVAIFCIGLISFTLVRKSEAERSEIEQIHWRERNKAQEYLNIAGVIIVAINTEQKVTLINRKGCKILGYEEEEITGKNWFDHFLPEWDRERVRATFIRLIPGGQKAADYFENPVLTKSGEERIIAWHNTLLTDETGNITGTLSSGEDITEHKKAEEALKESEERFRQLAENIDQVFWLTDWDAKRLLYVNPAYERLYGRSCQSAYDDRMSWQDVIHPEDRAQVREAFARSADLSQYVEAEYRIVRDDGTMCWVLDRSYPIRDKYGRVFRFASVAEDITERKKAEEALRENEERLKLVLEGAELGSWDQNMETGEVVRNRRWVEMLGYTLEEIDSHADAWKELIHPDDLPIVNRIVEDSQFELEFADFLERLGDDEIVSFAKNYYEVHFKIDYKNADGTIANYYPDFFVKTDEKTVYVVETKGREDLDDLLKIKRLAQWCDDANARQKKSTYKMLYVRQEEWDKYKPKNWDDIVSITKK